MEASTTAHGPDTLWSSRLEVLMTISRVAEALEALPSPTDPLTTRRWNHGIARELWIAISAIGVEGASSIGLTVEQHTVPAVALPPLAHLFRAVSWTHRRLAFDITRLDRESFLASAHALLSGPISGGDNWGFPKWWLWKTGDPAESTEMPGWWIAPTMDVGPPIPLFESDRADIEAASGKAYKTLATVSLQKECQLEGIEGRITELKLSLSD